MQPRSGAGRACSEWEEGGLQPCREMSLTTFYRRISLSDWLDRAGAGEAAPLLGRGLRRDWRRRAILAGLALLVLALVLTLSVWAAVGRAPGPSPPGPARAAFSLLSLSVWGCPASFGCPDKKERIAALGRYLAHHGPELVVLQELWMRPDHEVVRAGGAAAGYSVTAVGELAPDICDGRVLPSFCSGLAVLSRLPVLATQFTAFTDRGSFWSGDGEYWARKVRLVYLKYRTFVVQGVGRVRVEVNNKTVDVFSTSLAASDDNVWYRQRQAGEFGRAVAASTADIVIAAGNFESDPRSSETTYRSVLGKMSNTALGTTR